MLIFEGSRFAGLTTAARAVLQALPRHLYRELQNVPPRFHHYFDYDACSSVYFSQDRFHMTQLVYGEIVGDGAPMDENRYRLIDGMLSLKGMTTVVICFEDPTLLTERCEDAGIADIPPVLAVNNAYYDLERHFPDYDVMYDYQILLNRDKPYITELDLQKILDQYQARLESLLQL